MYANLCSPEFITFINALSNIYVLDTKLYQQALTDVADITGIGRVKAEFAINPLSKDMALDIPIETTVYYEYEHGYATENIFQKEIVTDDNNAVLYSFAPRPNKEFPEDMKPVLGMIANAIQVSVGRIKLFEVAEINKFTDQITGLKNINYFIKFGSDLLEKGQLSDYCCFFFNIKNFSFINRKLNFLNGNKLMMEYARTLLQHFEDDELLANVGGDNFCALVHKSNTEKFKKVLQSSYVTVENDEISHEFRLSSTAGIYLIPDDIDSISEVLDAVTNVFALAKKGHSQPFMYFDEKISNTLREEKYYSSIFESALEHKQIHIFYQPKVSLKDYTIIGAEALSRWIINGEVISPAKFIPVLEKEVAKICRLDFYVLEEVCKHILSWQERGIKPVRISVNFSKLHLSDSEFVNKIIDTLNRYSVSPEYIEIELTESVRSSDIKRLKDAVREMRKHNLKTSIDDFGTGYSSLSLIKDLDVDILKIDKCFIDHVTDGSDKDRILFKNIINIANDFGMEIVSEGVETVEQEEFLESINCNIAQGYLFDKPLPKEVFEQKLIKNDYRDHIV